MTNNWEYADDDGAEFKAVLSSNRETAIIFANVCINGGKAWVRRETPKGLPYFLADLVKQLIAQKAEIERLNSQLSQARTALRGVTKLAESRRL